MTPQSCGVRLSRQAHPAADRRKHGNLVAVGESRRAPVGRFVAVHPYPGGREHRLEGGPVRARPAASSSAPTDGVASRSYSSRPRPAASRAAAKSRSVTVMGGAGRESSTFVAVGVDVRARDRVRLEPLGSDRLAGDLVDAVRAFVEALQRGLDLGELALRAVRGSRCPSRARTSPNPDRPDAADRCDRSPT